MERRDEIGDVRDQNLAGRNAIIILGDGCDADVLEECRRRARRCFCGSIVKTTTI